MFCPQVCLCTTLMQCPQRSEEDVGSSGTGVTGGCELPGGCGTRTCVFCQSSMYSSQLNFLQHSLCFLFAVVDVCILRQGFAMRPRLARNWGSLLSPGCTSLFLSLPFVLQKPSFTHLPQEQAPTSLLLFPTAGQFLGIFSQPNVAAAASEATGPLSVPLLLLPCSWLCCLSLLFASWILSTHR